MKKFGVREICDVVLKAKAPQKIGTKIFYTIGAILMIGAAVVLITRKRTSQAK